MFQRYFLATLAALLLAAPRFAQAQTGSVGIGTTTPAASAALEIKSTTQGLLLPRLSQAQRDALTASATAPPVPGLVIYQTDNTPGLYAYDGAAWIRLGADNLGNHIATQNLDLGQNQLVGNAGSAGLAITSTGNVGLGTTQAQPTTQKLDVRGNVRLGADGGSNATGTGQAIEFVGPGINTDPVGIYRVNPASDASELRVVVGDGVDANDKFVVGRMPGTSTEGGLPTGSFSPTFSVNAAGQVSAPILGNGSSTRMVTTDAAGTLDAQPLPTDAQRLNLAGNTLSISGVAGPGASVTLPATGDNLGNHTATRNLNLAGNLLVGGTAAMPSIAGLAVSATGQVGIGTPSPTQALDVNGNVRIGTSTPTAAPGQVLTPTTGAHNMLAVAYGQLFSTNNGTAGILSGTDNYTLGTLYGGSGTVYAVTIQFTAASGLSTSNLSRYPVIATRTDTFGYIQPIASGYGQLLFIIGTSTGGTSSGQFNFVMYQP